VPGKAGSEEGEEPVKRPAIRYLRLTALPRVTEEQFIGYIAKMLFWGNESQVGEAYLLDASEVKERSR
jgi:hypothetical protein